MSSPTAGVSYGAHGVWSWETEPSEPLNHEGSGVAKPWNRAMELPGSDDLKHLANLFTSVEWWTLRPEQKLLSSQPGGDDPTKYVAVASSTDGDFAILYLPEGGEVTLDMNQLNSDLQAVWLNPRDGSQQEVQSNGSGTYESPNSEDWVLYLHN